MNCAKKYSIMIEMNRSEIQTAVSAMQQLVACNHDDGFSSSYIVQDQELTRPIHFAAQRGKCDVIQGLITEYGVDPTSKAVVS